MASGRRLAASDKAGRLLAMAFSPDGSLLATGAADGEVALWRVP
jgi:WD40 repeat protein